MPNKGALAEPAAEMMREAGYNGRRDSKELVVLDPENDVELFFLRPRDIAVYVGQGTLDVGITGRDLLLDSASPATETLALGFGASTFRYAGLAGSITDVADLDGRRVAEGVRMLVVPGSMRVRMQAEQEGLGEIFLAAGAEWRQPGCSMCLGMNPDTLSPGQRCASTSNRNFEGRQGKGGRTHLVSPAVAAATAVVGRFAAPADLTDPASKGA